MGDKRESWSNWKLNTLLQCGEKFRLKFREYKREPKKLFFARGNAVASVVEVSHTRQLAAKQVGLGESLPLILSSSLPTLEEAKDLAADKFNREASEGGYVLDDSDIEDGNDTIEKATGAAKDAAIDMAATYVEHVAPAINPVAVEHKVVVNPKGASFTISGVIDLVEEQTPEVLEGKEGVVEKILESPREVIRDTKTKTKAPKPDEADRSAQLTMYALLRMLEVGNLPDALALDHVVRTQGGKKTKPKNYVTRQYTYRDKDDLRMLYHRINVAVQAADTGLFLPASESAWWCSPKWCSFYGKECRFTRTAKKRPES